MVTATGPNSISVSPLNCAITDGSYHIRINTTTAVSLTGLAATNPSYVVLRWAYSASSTNYMDVLVITSAPAANDLIVAKLTGIGSTIAIDYSTRSNAETFIKNLLVEATETPSMYVHIRSGKASFGPSTYNIVDQQSALFSTSTPNALSSGQSRIDVIGVDDTGTVVVVAGTPATTGSEVAPSYGTILGLAEITLTYGMSSIVASNIRNVQNAARYAGNAVLLTGDQTVAGIKTFSSSPVVPTPTTNLQAVHKQYVDQKSGLGSPSNKVINAIYQAATDGFLVGTVYGEDSLNYSIRSDGSTTPTTVVGYVSWHSTTTNCGISFCIPIKRGNYYQLVQGGSGDVGNSGVELLYFIPVGS
jgi:hypothetical protein